MRLCFGGQPGYWGCFVLCKWGIGEVLNCRTFFQANLKLALEANARSMPRASCSSVKCSSNRKMRMYSRFPCLPACVSKRCAFQPPWASGSFTRNANKIGSIIDVAEEGFMAFTRQRSRVRLSFAPVMESLYATRTYKNTKVANFTLKNDPI